MTRLHVRAALVSAALLLLVGGASAQTVRYVDQDAVGGGNDGTSWEDAYLDLAVALAANGDFDGAVEVAGDAIRLARRARASGAVRAIEDRRAAFERREAYVDRPRQPARPGAPRASN